MKLELKQGREIRLRGAETKFFLHHNSLCFNTRKKDDKGFIVAYYVDTGERFTADEHEAHKQLNVLVTEVEIEFEYYGR